MLPPLYREMLHYPSMSIKLVDFGCLESPVHKTGIQRLGQRAWGKIVSQAARITSEFYILYLQMR